MVRWVLTFGFANGTQERRAREVVRLRSRQLYYLFLFFLVLAVLASPFQSLALHLLSGGIIELNDHNILASVYTRSNFLWCCTACSLCAVLLIRYDRNLRSFVRVAAVWSFALIFSDAFVDGIIPTVSSSFIANFVFISNFASDLLGGAIGGLLATVLFRRAHPWTRFHAQRLANKVDALEISKPSKISLHVDAAALATGWTGIFLIPVYWIWLVLGLFFALMAYYKFLLIIRAVETLHSYSWLFYHWKRALLPVAIFVGYIPVLLFIRFATKSVFSYNRRACRVLFCVSSALFVFLTAYLFYSQPLRVTNVPFLENTAVFGASVVGFWYGFRHRKASVRSAYPLRVNKHLFRVARLIRLTALSTPFRVWIRAAHRPMSVLQSILSSPETGLTNTKLIKLTIASVQITFLFSLPLFWYYHLPLTDFKHKSAEYAFLILSLLLGGIVYHLVFRLLSKPSNLFSTLAIYAVPQLIFMPLISALSIVALNFEYAKVKSLRLEHLHGLAIVHSIFSLQFEQSPRESLMQFTTLSEGVIIGIIQLFFLEAYCQFYNTDRHASYKVGTLAGLLNALALLVMVSPVRDLLYYYML